MDKLRFDYYINLMNFMSKTVGPDYEIILVDTRHESIKIIEIVNGAMTGRDINDIPPLVEKAVEEKEYLEYDYIINRTSYGPHGKALRSSMFFIKDQDNNLNGILCVNFDDSRFKNLSDQLFNLCHPDVYFKDNTEAQDRDNSQDIKYGTKKEEKIRLEKTLEEQIDEELSNLTIPIDRMNQDDKVNIIKRLDDKGIFLIKGAVNIVSEKMDSSQASIYRYLNMIKEE